MSLRLQGKSCYLYSARKSNMEVTYVRLEAFGCLGTVSEDQYP